MKHTFLLQDSSTLRDAIQSLDEGGIGFLAFVDQEQSLQGILTDGDLRRAILNKNNDLLSIINKSPVTMPHASEKREVIAKLKSLHRRHMPLVDNENKLKSVFSLDDIEFVSKDNTVVIMAGGLGTRLGELTKEKPKPMLNVGDRPMLQHIVEQFRDQGFCRFIFCLNYKKEVIEDYFGCGDRFGVKIDYVIENSRMGTAGALSLINQALDRPFFVINGDVLTNLDFNDFLDFHMMEGSKASMCVRQYQQQIPYGVINTDDNNQITSIEEKPSYFFNVNAGIYLLDPEILPLVPKDTFFDMPTLFEKLVLRSDKTTVFKVHDYWLDIGQREDYHKANIDMSPH